jgi:hypothetical protein
LGKVHPSGASSILLMVEPERNSCNEGNRKGCALIPKCKDLDSLRQVVNIPQKQYSAAVIMSTRASDVILLLKNSIYTASGRR